MNKILTFLLVLVLSACQTDKVLLKGSGVEAPWHPGAIKLCTEHPELELCKGGK